MNDMFCALHCNRNAERNVWGPHPSFAAQMPPSPEGKAFGRTTSSVFRQKRKRFHRNPPSPEGNVVNLAKVVIGKEFTTSVKTSVAATISRHAIFCGGRLPPLRRVLRCAVTGRFLKLMTLPLRGSCLRSRLKRCPRYTSFVYSDRRSYPSGDTSSDPLRGPPSPPRGRLLETV